MGGWRIIRTLGKGLVEIDSPQGMAAEAASAAIILSSSHLGMALSTTHVATGSILGTGVGRKGAAVRWGVAGRMAIAWVLTLPAAGLVGALCWFLAHSIGGAPGVGVVFAILCAASLWMYLHSRKAPVSHHNVNNDWPDDGVVLSDDDADPEPPPSSLSLAMEILSHAFAAIWQVLVVGLVLGAGLPALFALGMLSLSRGRMAGADGHLRSDAPPVSSARQGRRRRLLRARRARRRCSASS